jgi:hypothetical protein
VVERPVLLHEEDDVLDVGDRARAVVGGTARARTMLVGRAAAKARIPISLRNVRRSVSLMAGSTSRDVSGGSQQAKAAQPALVITTSR